MSGFIDKVFDINIIGSPHIVDNVVIGNINTCKSLVAWIKNVTNKKETPNSCFECHFGPLCNLHRCGAPLCERTWNRIAGKE